MDCCQVGYLIYFLYPVQPKGREIHWHCKERDGCRKGATRVGKSLGDPERIYGDDLDAPPVFNNRFQNELTDFNEKMFSPILFLLAIRLCAVENSRPSRSKRNKRRNYERIGKSLAVCRSSFVGGKN